MAKPRALIGKWCFILLCAIVFALPCRAGQMIGYWEGWGSISLADVSPNYDVVILSFADGSGADNATMSFGQSVESTSQLQADVATLHGRGVKVLLSVGGGGGPHTVLQNADDLNNFVTSIEGIISKYNLDGVDLDLENGIFAVDAGDNDLFHPTTPTIVNLITAMHQLKTHFGAGFMITAPPESEAMNGYGYYGNQVGSGWTSAYGGFLSFLNGTRDILSFIAPQYYDAAPYYGLDNNTYTQGSRDFDVSQAELILNGYTLVTGQYFPPIAQSQLAVGVPATNWGDGSYQTPSNVLQAVEYLGSGTSYGGNYHLMNNLGYPGFAGVMTWDINGDSGNGYALANTLAPYLHSLPAGASTMVDDFDDLSITSTHSSNWIVSNGVGQIVSDDPDVLQRSVDDTEYLVYHAGGMVSFNLRVYDVNAINDVSFFSSPDGSTWSPVTVTTGSKTASAAGWGWYDIITSTSLPSGTNYLKIVVGPTGQIADPLLSLLAITYTGSTTQSTPGTPKSVTAQSRNTAITLAWQSVSGATAYNVYRGTSQGGESATPVAVVRGTSFVDFGLASNNTYYYKIAAVNAAGTSAQSTEVSAVYVVEGAYPSTPAAVPGVVEADNYDTGGSGIAYYANGRITSPTGLYRTDGAAVEACSDNDGAGNGYDVGSTTAGDYLNYTVNSEAYGTYNLALRVASANGGTLHIRAVNGLDISPAISVPKTGGSQTWSTVNTSVSLMAGEQIVRLYCDTGGVNVEYLKFTDQTPSTPSNLAAGPSPTGGVQLTWLPSSTGAATYNVYRGTSAGGEGATPIATGVVLSIANNMCVYNDASPAYGATNYYTVKAVNSTGTSAASNEASMAVGTPGPFNGSAAAVPGTVQAENYDVGGPSLSYYVTSINGSANNYRSDGVDLEACTDTGGGYDLGWTSAGQWFKYTVNVAATQAYLVTFRVASGATDGVGGTFHLQDASGNDLTGPVTVPVTGGWETWTDVSTTVNLTAGTHTLTVYQDVGGFNLNYFTLAALPLPSVPTGLSAVGGDDNVALSWTSSTGATSYNVYRSTTSGGEGGSPIATGVSTASYSDTAVTNGTKYYYEVAAVNSVGTSAKSTEVNATPNVPAPPPPTNLTAASGNGSATLNWSASTGATTYNVYMGTSAGGESSTALANVTGTSYTATGLTNGTKYYFTVKAVNSAGASGASNEASTTPQAPVPPAPTDLAAVAGDGQVSLSWTNSTGATSYNVYMGTSAGGEGSTALASVSGTAYTATGLTNGTTYYFTVTAVNAGGSSAASNEASATPALPAPAAPANLTGVAGNVSVSLTWSPSVEATSYNVYAGTAAGGESATAIASVSGTNCLVTGLTNGTTYYFVAKAVNAGGTSLPSNEVSATPQGAPQTAPSNLTAVAGNTSVSLTWTGSTGATSYNVYEGTSAGGESTTPVGTVTDTSYAGTGLKNGTKYYFYVKGVGAAGTSAASNEASATPVPPISYSAGVQFISTPIDYSSTPIDALFGVTGVKLAVWQPAGYAYAVTPTAPADRLRLGVGYWVNLSSAVTLHGSGTPADSSQDYSIPLTAGWNSIGDPFFSSVTVASLTVDGSTFTQASSGSTPIVSSTLYGWDGSKYVTATSIAPESGYWIYAYSSCTLSVPHP